MQGTNYTKQNRPLKANKSTGSHIICILWNQKVRAVFKRNHLDRSWTRRIQCTPFFPLSLMAIWYYPPNHTNVFQTVSLLESPRKGIVRTIPPYVPAYLIFLDVIAVIFCEYKLRSSSLCHFLQSPAFSSLLFLCPNISLGTPFWNTLSLCPVLNVRTKFHTY